MSKKISPTPEQQSLLEAMTKSGIEVIEGRKLTPEEQKICEQTHREVTEYLINLERFQEESRKSNIRVSYQQPSYVA